MTPQQELDQLYEKYTIAFSAIQTKHAAQNLNGPLLMSL